ncbi:MAG: hypothetical protein II840_02750 [Kiritimatiellae bacterium]|nr:hypothetical protein [Kiritimatiellia bacterium]
MHFFATLSSATIFFTALFCDSSSFGATSSTFGAIFGATPTSFGAIFGATSVSFGATSVEDTGITRVASAAANRRLL